MLEFAKLSPFIRHCARAYFVFMTRVLDDGTGKVTPIGLIAVGARVCAPVFS